MKRRLTAQRLDNIALHYLERFASSSANLERVLLRRVERMAREAEDGDAVREEGARLVVELIARYRRSGLLDDGLYAAAKARSLHRRGGSTRAIRQALAAKGIDSDTAAAALDALSEDGNTDETAALALARRRRLGPFRTAGRAEHRDKDMAALARAGFSYEVARRIVDAEEA